MPKSIAKVLVGGVLDRCGIAGPMRIVYYGFYNKTQSKKMKSIIRHDGGQAEIDNVIKEYLQRFSDANPKILRIIADKMQGKPTTEQC
jgi:hypothetical protein